MSGQVNGTENEVDEPEEGEIQDDEGSLEDVSSDEEIAPLAEFKESDTYASTFIPVHRQFSKIERQNSQSCRREMRFCPPERTDSSVINNQNRRKSGCWTAGDQDSYYDNIQRYKSLKEYNLKVSGKIHEKENKAKESKKAHRRSSFYGNGSELRNSYFVSEHSDPYFSSSAPSKGLWRKIDAKEKHKKKKKNTKSNRYCSPLGEVCASRLKIVGNSSSLGGVKSDVQLDTQIDNNIEMREVESLPQASPSSEIEVLDIPIIPPEVITIFDSDEEGLKIRNKDDSIYANKVTLTSCLSAICVSSEKVVLEQKEMEDSEENLKILREAALKSSKPELRDDLVCDDEVLQLRLEALRSAIIRKCEERKKRGIMLSKTNKNFGQQIMSISPLGSPNYSSSGDTSLRGDKVNEDDKFCQFNESNCSSALDPTNDGEVDKITTIDMEIVESDEDKDTVYIDCENTSNRIINNHSNSTYRSADSTLLKPSTDDINCKIVSTVSTTVPVESSPLFCSNELCYESLTQIPSGYIIGDEDLEETSRMSGDCSETSHLISGIEVEILPNKATITEREFISEDQSSDFPNCEKLISTDNDLVEYNEERQQSLSCSKSPLNTNNNLSNIEHVQVRFLQSECSDLSSEKDLDLDSMIILDEIGSDDTSSECFEEDNYTSGNFNCGSETILVNNYVENVEKSSDKSNIDIGSLISNSKSSSEILPIHAEVSEDSSEMSRDNAKINFLNVFSNSRSSTSEKASDIFEAYDSLNTFKEIPENAIDVVLSNSNNDVNTQTVCEINSQTNLDEPSILNANCKGDPEKPNVCSVSQNGKNIQTGETYSERIDDTNVNKPERTIQCSSDENYLSLDNVVELREQTDRLMPEDKSSSLCHDKEVIELRVKNNCNAIDKQMKEDSALFADGNNKSKENNTKNQRENIEDDENVLRVNLLAMLKKGSVKESNEIKQYIDHQTNEKNTKLTSASSASKNGEYSSLNFSHVAPLTENISEAKQTRSLIHSIPKQVSYSVCNSLSIDKRQARSNKLKCHDTKVPGKFNVNVPKLVINLGEDSDSGDDSECVTMESKSVSNTQEPSDNSESVSADFAKKLDLLLKQARTQQETVSKDDMEIEDCIANVPVSSQQTIGKLPSSTKNVDIVRRKLLVSGDNSTLFSSSVHTNSLVINQNIGHQVKKSIGVSAGSKYKNVLSGNNLKVTKLSKRTVADVNTEEICKSTKNISTSTQTNPSISSVVDIGFLPSSKQKEYIRLKRQLAQLSHKEQEIKSKENSSVLDNTKLLVNKSALGTMKGFSNSNVKHSIPKSTFGIRAEKCIFSRRTVRRGRGISVVSRSDLGKSRSIAKTLLSANTSLNTIHNQLTSITSNKPGNTSFQESANVRHASCLTPKKSVTTPSNLKKVTLSNQIATSNDCNNSSEQSMKSVSVANKCSLGSVNQVNKTSLQEKREKSKDVMKGAQIVVERDDIIQLENSEKIVLKNKGNIPLDDQLLPKKSVLEKDHDEDVSTDLNKANQENKRIESIIGECNIKSTNDNTNKYEGNKTFIKRKRSNSEDSGNNKRKASVVCEISVAKMLHRDGSNRCDGNKIQLSDKKKLAEELWCSESKLISKRYQMLQDIAAIQVNLLQIEKVQELKQEVKKDIERLKRELCRAEAQLNKEEQLLGVLYSEVENTKRDIMRRQSETLLLSVECEEMGCKVHGSSYCVPNTCTDLIQNGMGTISKTLQDLKGGRNDESEFEVPNTCESGGVKAKYIATNQQISTGKELENLSNKDSDKQIPGSYFSPLESIRTTAELMRSNPTNS